ncbi:Hpt domain-containing protein [Aeoliella mucimassa]|uniref:Chemotaxis protein CheA n=1 Tax=Aeoliella mucimassa TaxID=2527972 RepID=A0A518ALP6_9BACT|nr:Hpt domain-containing protein [Aeoliella mucimassa]QDU55614.1 Chemotaxis protein CheA [Aeoliella mucimassa]
MSTNVKNYRNIFFEESIEHLADVEAGLLGLEGDPNDSSLLDQVFRGVHSIKGGAATFGLEAVANFSHSLENHLDRLRAGECENDANSADALFRSVDCLRALVEAAQSEESLEADTTREIEEITNILSFVQEAAQEAIVPVEAPVVVAAAEVPVNTKQDWSITFVPGPGAFQNGLDPTLIWRELSQLGDLKVELDNSNWPC